MPTNNLTDAACRLAKPREKPFKLFDGGGLHLWVSEKGSKVWRIAYRIDGKPQQKSLGPYPLFSLADARKARDEFRKRIFAGDIARSEKNISLNSATLDYWERRLDISESYRANAIHAIERHILPKIGHLSVRAVTRDQLLNCLNAMDAAGLSVYVRKTRMWLSQVFDWATEQNYCDNNPCASINPQKAFSAKSVASFAALELSEVPAFLERLKIERQEQSVIACQLLALTWVRTVELRGMQWSEIEGDLWRIPAQRMKKKRDHLVPLSSQAIALIETMRLRNRGGVYVFPNDRTLSRPMSENAILYLIGRIGYKGRMTGHGWRTIASTWANENGFGADAIEKQLAHSPDDKVRAVYNRAEFMPERRAMLQAWANWLRL